MTEERTIGLFVNGRPVIARVSPKITLLRYLRDELCLTGTKNGCSTGHCGACMVLIDNEPVKSCITKVSNLENKNIITIEGLTKEGELSPIQASYLASGAVQCGFCTPGLIVATHALLVRTPTPTEEEIREGLKNNICRCTGYSKIIDAARLAARWSLFPEEIQITTDFGLGNSIPDYDGIEKVTGRLTFADDLYLKDMLYGKIVWSRYPHAEILSIDISDAQSVLGVRAVLTADNVPGLNGMGSLIPDQPVLCKEKVRFMGDMIAVVFAETLAVAEEGARKVFVDYCELPGIFSPNAALEPEAPLLHEKGNIAKHLMHEIGDIDEGFKQAEVIAIGHFETPFVEHAYLEPETSLGYVDENGVVTVKTPTQFPFEMRRQLSAMLALPEENIRLIATPVGGAFGSKLENTTEALKSKGQKIGIGVASGFKNVGAGKGKVDDAGAIFSLELNGRITLKASAVDMGQGIRTALIQIAVEVLKVDGKLIDIITGDTALTIHHGGAVGERQILISGKAVELAAIKFKVLLLEKAAELLHVSVEKLQIVDDKVSDLSNKEITFTEMAAKTERIEVSHYYVAPKTYALGDKEAKKNVSVEEYRNYPSYAYTTQIAIVKVDVITGNTKVLKVIAAHDCGKAINPQKIEGQIEGSILQGQGYALSEGYYLQNGIPVTRNYKQLGVPTILDTPAVESIIIEDPEPSGPFGAKGVSEVATVPITPAILNAIYDAIGIRFYTLPVTPSKILSAIRARNI